MDNLRRESARTLLAERITAVLSDPCEVVVQGLGRTLAAEAIEVVGTAVDLPAMLREVGTRRPDVLMADVELLATDPGGLVTAARQASPDTRILILFGQTRLETIEAALAAGPDGHISKSESIRQLVAAVRELALGRQYAGAWRRPHTPRRLDASVELMVRSLSERELTILRHLAAGHSNNKIAAECRLSLNTVRGHVQNILVKLGVHSKVEAVWFAVQHGVVSLTDGPADRRDPTS